MMARLERLALIIGAAISLALAAAYAVILTDVASCECDAHGVTLKKEIAR